jgi:hypothetical protein
MFRRLSVLVKITFQPWDEVVVHEAVEYPLAALLEMQSFGVPPGGVGRSLMWANGVAFAYVAMPASEDIVAEQLKGRMHWASVAYALMPRYESVVLLQETNVRVPVVDVSVNPGLYAVARWLRERAA